MGEENFLIQRSKKSWAAILRIFCCPAGTQLRCYPFDGSKKKDWFWVDFDGVFYGTLELAIAGLVFIAIIGGGIYATTGFDIMVLTTKFFETRLNAAWCLLIFMVLNVLIAFYVVFVRRWNPNVIGKPRQFKYCRWF